MTADERLVLLTEIEFQPTPHSLKLRLAEPRLDECRAHQAFAERHRGLAAELRHVHAAELGPMGGTGVDSDQTLRRVAPEQVRRNAAEGAALERTSREVDLQAPLPCERGRNSSARAVEGPAVQRPAEHLP